MSWIRRAVLHQTRQGRGGRPPGDGQCAAPLPTLAPTHTVTYLPVLVVVLVLSVRPNPLWHRRTQAPNMMSQIPPGTGSGADGQCAAPLPTLPPTHTVTYLQVLVVVLVISARLPYPLGNGRTQSTKIVSPTAVTD